jgi:hypothetical protein
VIQITDEKFEELYKQFQKQKNNLGSDPEFAEFLNKKNIVPGTPGATTGVLNKEFNAKTVNGRRQRLGIKTPTAGKIIGQQLANRTKIENLLQKEITKANNGDKFISQGEISFKVEDKLGLKPKTVISPDTGKPRRVPRYVPSKGGALGAYPILYNLESQIDKVDNVLKDLLIDQEPLKDRLVEVIKKKTQVGDLRFTLQSLRATPTFKVIKDEGGELLVKANKMNDYKGLNLSDQLSLAIDKQLGKPVYTGLGGVKSRFYGPNYVTMKFAKESWNQNKGQGPIQFFDSKGNRIEWKRGLKLPIQKVSFKYKGKNHTYKDLSNASYIKKYFPEVFEKTVGVNNLKSKKVDNPFKPGSKINLRDLVQKVQEKGYGWSPRMTKFDILHGPGGVKDNPFTNLRYNTRDINQLELGLDTNLKSKKINKSQYNQALKNLNAAFKGLKGDDYDQAIIDRVTTQANKIKKGTFYGYDIIKQNILTRATNNDNNICEVVFGAKGQANGGPVGGGCGKQMELEFDKAPEQTLNKIAQSTNPTLKGFAQRSLSLFPKLGTVGKIGTVAAGAGIALSGLRYNPEKGEIVTTDNDQKADQNQILQYVKDNPLKVTAGSSLGFAAQEVPGAYKAARDLGRGRVRSTLGISGAIRPVLTTFGTPLLTGLYEGAIGAKRLDEGETMTDILTDPVGPALGVSLMEPLSKLSGVVKDAPKRTMLEGAKNYFNLSNVGQARPGITGQVLRMGMSPKMIAGASRFLGLPGLALGLGMSGYDAYKNYQNQEGMIYNLFNKDE